MRCRRALDAPLDVEDDRVDCTSGCCCASRSARRRERLYLSYPRIDIAQARPRVPSFYALDIIRALTGSRPELRTSSSARPRGHPAPGWRGPRPPIPAEAIDDRRARSGGARAAARTGRRAARRRRGHARTTCCSSTRVCARSLLTRWARWKRRWSAYDGLMTAARRGRRARPRAVAEPAPRQRGRIRCPRCSATRRVPISSCSARSIGSSRSSSPRRSSGSIR